MSYGGQFEAQQSATRTILVTGLIIAVLMFMLLQISTGSIRAALLVMLNMPLALIGGIIAILLTEGGSVWSNIFALTGFETSGNLLRAGQIDNYNMTNATVGV